MNGCGPPDLKTSGFAIEPLLKRLAQLPPTRKYWVGFSGGADSTALLLALKLSAPSLSAEIQAVHFNHGLHPDATAWQDHCRSFCEARNIPLLIRKLDLGKPDRSGLEAQARNQRYRAVEYLLGEGEIYLTAHHANDCAETLFLNLMRGSGLNGLAGIPGLRKLGAGWVARPLLPFKRRALEAFLLQREVDWLEDPSNTSLEFDRNFVRHRVFPQLEERWPGVISSLNQTSEHAQELGHALQLLLASQYGDLICGEFTLPLAPLLDLDPVVQVLILRNWIRAKGLNTPPRLRLNEFLQQLRQAGSSASKAEIRWSDCLLKHHAGFLWLHLQPGPGSCPTRSWTSGICLNLGPGFGELRLNRQVDFFPEGWQVGPRKKGQRMQLHENGPRRKLKELMRESAIPPWLRDSIPVLCMNGEVAAVGDWLISARLSRQVPHGEKALTWLPTDPLLCKLQSVSVQFLGQANSSI